MTKLFLVIACALSTFTAGFAQTGSFSALGIGTSYPTAPLEVRGGASSHAVDVSSTQDEGFAQLYLHTAHGTNPSRYFIKANTDGSNWNALFSVNHEGHVFGTGLEIDGDFVNYKSGLSAIAFLHGSGFSQIHTPGNWALKLGTNGTERMVIGAGGYVGIGTANPQTNLHLYGPNPGILLEGDGNSYYPYIRLKSLAGDGWIDNYNVTNVLNGINMHLATANGRVSLGVTGRGNVSYSENPALVTHNVVGANGQTADIFQVSQYTPEPNGSFSSTPVFRISPTGNVYIGTNSPSQYKLAVEGRIGARKLVVTQNPNWADYVFNDDYRLPRLQEVEAYIKQHKHLPGIVTTKDVEKNGLDLGSNQAALLKKVEELTLYAIQQQKEIDELKKEIKKQRN